MEENGAKHGRRRASVNGTGRTVEIKIAQLSPLSRVWTITRAQCMLPYFCFSRASPLVLLVCQQFLCCVSLSSICHTVAYRFDDSRVSLRSLDVCCPFNGTRQHFRPKSDKHRWKKQQKKKWQGQSTSSSSKCTDHSRPVHFANEMDGEAVLSHRVALVSFILVIEFGSISSESIDTNVHVLCMFGHGKQQP